MAMGRNARSVGVEEILFLIRKDHVRLSRLLKHLSLKEMRNQFVESTMNAPTGTDELNAIVGESSDLNGELNEQDLLDVLTGKNLSGPDSNRSTPTDLGSSSLSTASSNHPVYTRKVKICRDFLAKIDSTGELLRTLDQNFFDKAKHRRNLVKVKIFVFIFEQININYF